VLSRHIFNEQYWTGILILIGLIVVTAALSPLIQLGLIDTYRTWMNLYHPQKNIFFSFLGGLRGSMTIAGFAAAIKILKHWHFKKLENEQLEKQKLIAELELLKGQLHPHFMFNTLNSIYAQALKGSKETAQSILHLSHMMRYLMTDSTQSYIPLQDELKTIETYVAMEKNRLGNRVDLSISIRGELSNSIIAPLILLPFVENSFKHGVNQMTEYAWMSLDVQVLDHQLIFKLINGKPEQTNVFPSGIGLKNVRKRLELLYPKLHQLQIYEDEQTYVVSLHVQLNQNSLAA
jgi:LytS/YehU family sensor histidine kinase